ncbi:hypothetical protein JZ751_002997 [Albula glossodonta]|uniref:Uncharacterized protein n=1 Tax=Albula glossodonta TaxID=121402 RepID=A0A8T2NBE8_9TELE|nr:hypothetical protein JZ751_002997 [Albula glossodonta]
MAESHEYFPEISRTMIRTLELVVVRPADMPPPGTLSSARICRLESRVVPFRTKNCRLGLSKSSDLAGQHGGPTTHGVVTQVVDQMGDDCACSDGYQALLHAALHCRGRQRNTDINNSQLLGPQGVYWLQQGLGRQSHDPVQHTQQQGDHQLQTNSQTPLSWTSALTPQTNASKKRAP